MARAKLKTIKADDGKRPPELAEPVCADLEAILGHDRQITLLREVMASGRVHHAWLFAGPPGVGKRTTAQAFCAALLEPALEHDLAGRLHVPEDSPTRQRIERGVHPDFHMVRKELALFHDDPAVRDRKLRNIPIDVIRERLIEPAQRQASIVGPSIMHKAFIIDEAELLRSGDNAAQNALLKTLEEPPPGTVIVLVSASEEALLPTIRSRCQTVRFGPLDERSMQAWMARSGLDLPDAERRWVLAYAAGSPGRAEVAAQTGLFSWWQRIGPMLGALESGRFPAELGSQLASMVDEWAEARVKGRPEASKEAAKYEATSHLLTMLGEYFRRVLRSDEPRRRVWAARAVDLLVSCERDVHANVSLKLAMPNLIARLAHGSASEIGPAAW